MPKATIRTRSGTEIIVESDKETINDIVATIQRREEMRDRFRQEFKKRRSEMVRGKQKPLSATDMILRLKHEGYFKKKRSLGDIQKELEKHGYIYPQTTLSAVILRLLRKGELGRVRDEKQWRYVQR